MLHQEIDRMFLSSLSRQRRNIRIDYLVIKIIQQITYYVMKNEAQQDSFDVMNFFIDFQNKREEFSIQPPESSQPQCPLSLNKKVSNKNKYLNKVKVSCEGISTSARPREQLSAEPSLDFPIDKRQRNKIAAKESRDRKKLYIQIIQKETRSLEEQLRRVNSQIEECKNEIQKGTQISDQNIGGASISNELGQVTKKLKRLVSMEDSYQVDSDLNLALDSICFRFALLGRERFSKINWGYNQILKLGVPTLHRYLMWSAKESCHFFANENAKHEQEQWFDEMRPILGDIMQKNKQKIKLIQQNLIRQKNKIVEVLKNFMLKRQQMVNLSGDVDQLQEEMRTIYTPKQIAKLILFNIDTSYKQELRYIENICYEDDVDSQLGEPKKKAKLDEQ